MLRIELERWGEFWPEARGLMKEHHEEISPEDRKGKFNPDFMMASQMDLMNVLMIVSARENEVLVGYCLWYLSTDLECAGMMIASQGPWFVTKGARKSTIGLKLMNTSLEALRARGVHSAMLHHWAKSQGVSLRKFFDRLGASPLETVYSLPLEV